MGPEERATRLREIMREEGFRIVGVGFRDRLLGVVYRSSLLLLPDRKSMARVRDLASQPPFTVSPDDPLEEVVEKMIVFDEWYVPVVDSNGSYRGFIGLESVLEEALTSEEGASILSNVLVRETCSRRVMYVGPDDPVSLAWHIMRSRRYSGLPVVADDGRVVGIITEHDLLVRGYTRAELENPDMSPRIRDSMSRPAIVMPKDYTLLEAARIMVEMNVGRLPVVSSAKEKTIYGIVDREDVIRVLLEV